MSDMTVCLNDHSYIPPNNEHNEPTQGDISNTSNKPTQAIRNEFEELYGSANEELYPGCDYVTRLDFMAKFTHFKVKGKLTASILNEMLEFFQFVFPPSKGYKLPPSYYGEDNKDKQLCPVCNTSRWKDNNITGMKVPKKVLRYFSFILRLQRVYKSSHTAKEMTWHDTRKCTNHGKMKHPIDARAWKKFDSRYLDFVAEPRNVRLGLAANGFNPFGNLSQSYSMWNPEGSIEEGYVAEEALTFSSHYFRDVTTKLNHPERNVECPPLTCQFQIRQRYIDKDPSVNESVELFALACGPSMSPISINSCVVNSVRFVVHSRDERHTTQNTTFVRLMSTDVTRGYGGNGGGDDRPSLGQIPTGCRGKGTRKSNRGGRKAGRLDTRGQTKNLRLRRITNQCGPKPIRFEFNDRGMLMPLDWDKQIAFWLDPKNLSRATQNAQNWAKSMVICRHGSRSLAVLRDMQEEMLRLMDLGPNTSSSVPYTDDEIMAVVHRASNGDTFLALEGFWRDREGKSSLYSSLDARTPTMSMRSKNKQAAKDRYRYAHEEPGEDEDADKDEDVEEDEDS
nr:hypothetical protein [Tanacetum cinerariifolium]